MKVRIARLRLRLRLLFDWPVVALVGFCTGLSACATDPACAPGRATAREIDCMTDGVIACNGFEGFERQACFEDWDGICEARASDYDARCTK